METCAQEYLTAFLMLLLKRPSAEKIAEAVKQSQRIRMQLFWIIEVPTLDQNRLWRH